MWNQNFPMLMLALVCSYMIQFCNGYDCASCVARDVSDLLCSAGWRDINSLDNMSGDDERNTLITELDKRTKNDGIIFDLGRSNDWQIEAGNLYLILKKCGWRTESEMRDMTIEDLRNTCIVELEKKGFGSIGYLQGMSNNDLVGKACEYSSRRNKPQEVVSFSLHIDQGAIANDKPELLGSETYNNCGSGVELNQQFSIKKTFSETNSLSYTDLSSSSVDFTVGLDFKAPLVGISASSSLTLSHSHSTTMNTAKSTMNSVEYTETSPVNVPPHKKIRKELIVNVANIDVPFTMVIKTSTGEHQTIKGVYTGVKTYNKQIMQTELPC